VLLIGDSITKPDATAVAEVDWWASQVAERLGNDYEVENLGAGGTTLLMWHGALYEGQVLPRQPADYVNILLGTNDASGWPDDPTRVDLFGLRLRELIGRIQDDGAGTVILMTPPRRGLGAGSALVPSTSVSPAIARSSSLPARSWKTFCAVRTSTSCSNPTGTCWTTGST